MPQIMAMQMGQQTIVDFDVPARMRDGTTLRANVYRPAGEGKWPVLLTRLPYGKDFPIGFQIRIQRDPGSDEDSMKNCGRQ